MDSWGEFAAAEPELAERGARLFGVGVAYIATTARDGSSRVHPFTPLIAGGRLLTFIGKHTVKYHNLLRDQRFSVHAVLGDSDEEFLIIGRATVSDDWATRMAGAVEARKINMTSTNDVAFELTIDRVHWAIWKGLGTPEIHRVAKRWEAAVPLGVFS
ncbi:MAG: pyridoxamine 5'-phosphate oxidase family protein [Dehalococcoidia bacterium]